MSGVAGGNLSGEWDDGSDTRLWWDGEEVVAGEGTGLGSEVDGRDVGITLAAWMKQGKSGMPEERGERETHMWIRDVGVVVGVWTEVDCVGVGLVLSLEESVGEAESINTGG